MGMGNTVNLTAVARETGARGGVCQPAPMSFQAIQRKKRS